MSAAPLSPRILIVDDAPDNIRVLGTILRQQAYQINVAQDGLVAVNLIEKIMPDLVLLDIMMPEMDGLETCRQIKSNPDTQDIPVIFLSAKVEEADVLRGFELGAADYITKPFNPRVLLARVKTHVTLYQRTKELQSYAEKDGLTRLANRRCFDEFLSTEWRRCQRNQLPISLIMLDIDFFKDYNDCYGHLQGDEALKKIAQVLEQTSRRPTDLAARYGGEEFALILGNTGQAAAVALAQRLHAQILALALPHQRSQVSDAVTASVGVATLIPSQLDQPADLIANADVRMYQAKQAGRNQVQF